MGVYYQITIVPEYSSNQSMETSVITHLSKLIDGKRYRGNKTLRIIVFRPTGRPADEFNDNVLPILRDFEEGVYLFIAFSGGYKNISDLVPESVRGRVSAVEPIFIQAGELVSEASANYGKNQTAFRSMAELMCRDHGLKMLQATRNRKKPEGTNLMSSFTHIWSSMFPKDKEHDELTNGPLQRQQSLPNSWEFLDVIPNDSEHVVLLAGVLHDSPIGIPVQKLCEIMKLKANDINRIVDQSPVFRKSPIRGKEYVCLSQKLISELNNMKEGKTYIEYMKGQRHICTPSVSGLRELRTTKDSLDPAILEDLDLHFQLDGKLPEILSRCFELFWGQTETPMETAESPPDASLTEPDHQEKPVSVPCHEPKPDHQEEPVSVPCHEPKPDHQEEPVSVPCHKPKPDHQEEPVSVPCHEPKPYHQEEPVSVPCHEPKPDHQEEPVSVPCHEPKPDQSLWADMELKPDQSLRAELEPKPDQS